MVCVDGYVLPLPKKNISAYKRAATAGAKAWIKAGALEYREAIGEDLKPKFGLPFPKLVKPKAGETIVFAWIVFKSRKHRDQVNARVMKDAEMASSMDHDNPPFDFKRMSYGGFDIIVDATAKKPRKMVKKARASRK
jgi:uncharacterized protein YbaA (DUF1428 family)